MDIKHRRIYDKIPKTLITYLYNNRDRELCISQIARRIDATNSTSSKIFDDLHKMKIVNKTLERKKYFIITLTKKGIDIAKLFAKIDDLVGQK
jgi:Mn-dependent DtxR family transcriptional regulator